MYRLSLKHIIFLSFILFFPLTLLAAPSCTFTEDLKEGSRGVDVQCLQTYLEEENFFPQSEPITTYFGPITKAAVIDWQQTHTIEPAVGYFGPISQATYKRLTATTTQTNILLRTTTSRTTLLNSINSLFARIMELYTTLASNTTNTIRSVISSSRGVDNPPDTPTNLTTSAGDATVSLTWTRPVAPDANYINIYRGTSPTSLSRIATTTPHTTSYTDVPVANSTTYYYALTTIDNAGHESDKTDATIASPVGVYDIYVDSVNGNDANDGTSDYEAFQTLATAETAALVHGDGVKIGLKRGSWWREDLDLASVDDAIISSYSTGALPIIDGADIFTDWSLTDGETNVYETSVTHDATGTNRLTIYEDGTLLTRVADVDTAASTPGSFVDVKGSDGSPVTVYIHPSDSGNPVSNGKLYEVTKRFVAFRGGEGNSVTGIHTQRAIANNGSFDLVNRPNSNVSNVLAAWGTKHNLGIGSGTTTDSIAYAADLPTSYEPSNIYGIAYLDDTSGEHVYVNRFVAVNQEDYTTLTGAFYGHGGSLYSTFTGKQVAAIGMNLGSPEAETVLWDGIYTNRTGTLPLAGNNTDDVDIKRAQINMTDGLGRTNQPTGADILYEDMAVYSVPSTIEFFRVKNTSTTTINQTIFVVDRDIGAGERRGMLESSPTATGVISVSKTILDFDTSFGHHISIPVGWTYSGDYNIFYNISGTPFQSKYNSQSFTSLADWQATTSQDINSVYLTATQRADFWLGDPSEGDFRINPNAQVTGSDGTVYTGEFPDGTPLTEAGPQSHWDWNERGAVSGTPTAWPDIPDTLEESKTYILDPEAWDFYPN